MLSSTTMRRGGFSLDRTLVSSDLAVHVHQVLREAQYLESGSVSPPRVTRTPVELAMGKKGFMRDDASCDIDCAQLAQLLRLGRDDNIHKSMALLCFHVMTISLRFNIAGIAASVRNREISDLDARIKTNISPFLLYCCRSWPFHTSLAIHDDTVVASMARFLATHALKWLEVMSLTDSSPEAPLHCLQITNVSILDVLPIYMYSMGTLGRNHQRFSETFSNSSRCSQPLSQKASLTFTCQAWRLRRAARTSPSFGVMCFLRLCRYGAEDYPDGPCSKWTHPTLILSGGSRTHQHHPNSPAVSERLMYPSKNCHKGPSRTRMAGSSAGKENFSCGYHLFIVHHWIPTSVTVPDSVRLLWQWMM